MLQLTVVLDNIELMFPKSGLVDTHLEMVALNQLQDMNADAPVIVSTSVSCAFQIFTYTHIWFRLVFVSTLVF